MRPFARSVLSLQIESAGGGFYSNGAVDRWDKVDGNRGRLTQHCGYRHVNFRWCGKLSMHFAESDTEGAVACEELQHRNVAHIHVMANATAVVKLRFHNTLENDLLKPRVPDILYASRAGLSYLDTYCLSKLFESCPW